jgi:hypothetical protein
VIPLVAGVAGLNVLLLAVGYCLLAACLGGPLRHWASWAGLALLLGAGATGVTVFGATILGATAGTSTLALAALLLAIVGLAGRWVTGPRFAAPRPPSRPAGWVATLAGSAVLVICVLGLVGGFRSSPWLDDAWGIWLPKGLALQHLGLDPRLFVPNGRFVAFEVPDYPLWWSVLTGLDVRFVGSVDVRAMDAQLALLAVAFLAAVARLLWGFVRPVVLWPALLLVAASPDFWRHAQGGMADLPLAIYLSLCVLVGVGWLATGAAFYLVPLAVFAATALAIKTEGLPEVALVAVALTVAGLLTARRRLLGLWSAFGVAALSYVPWLVWRADHDVTSRVGLGAALSPDVGRVGTTVGTVARHLTSPREWLLVVPLALALAVLGAVRERRPAWLVPAAGIALGYLFVVWAFASASDDLDFLLATASYRVVDAVVLTAAVLVPILAERLLGPG